MKPWVYMLWNFALVTYVVVLSVALAGYVAWRIGPSIIARGMEQFVHADGTTMPATPLEDPMN